jgi:hypothetical protein
MDVAHGIDNRSLRRDLAQEHHAQRWRWQLELTRWIL